MIYSYTYSILSIGDVSQMIQHLYDISRIKGGLGVNYEKEHVYKSTFYK